MPSFKLYGVHIKNDSKQGELSVNRSPRCRAGPNETYVELSYFQDRKLVASSNLCLRICVSNFLFEELHFVFYHSAQSSTDTLVGKVSVECLSAASCSRVRDDRSQKSPQAGSSFGHVLPLRCGLVLALIIDAELTNTACTWQLCLAISLLKIGHDRRRKCGLRLPISGISQPVRVLLPERPYVGQKLRPPLLRTRLSVRLTIA